MAEKIFFLFHTDETPNILRNRKIHASTMTRFLFDGQLHISPNETQSMYPTNVQLTILITNIHTSSLLSFLLLLDNNICTLELTGFPLKKRINYPQERTQTTMKCSLPLGSSVKTPVGRPHLPLIKPSLSKYGGNSDVNEGSGSTTLPTSKRHTKDPPIVQNSQRRCIGKSNASGQ